MLRKSGIPHDFYCVVHASELYAQGFQVVMSDKKRAGHATVILPQGCSPRQGCEMFAGIMGRPKVNPYKKSKPNPGR